MQTEERVLLAGGRLITRDAACPFIADGGVLIEGKLIKDVGETSALREKYPQARFMDARGRLIMPGFINTHMHYYSTFARGLALDGPAATKFSDILKGLWWRLDKALTLDDVYDSAILPMLEQVRCGVTTAIDHHASPFCARGSLFAIAEAAQKVGIRSNLCYETSDRDGEAVRDAGIAENVEFIQYCKSKNDDMLTALFGLHASMTLSEETLDRCLTAAAGAGFHVHAAEGIEDVEDALAVHGMRVVERFYKTGVLSDKSIAVHCIHITPDEMELLRDSGVAVVHNPESNMGNAVGTSPVLGMFQAGVLVGLGTDGYTADMTESYKVANILHKHAAGIPSVGWGEPPAMLFENNKRIAERFINGKLGTLAPGHYADVIVVDYDPPTPISAENINSHILFGVSGRHVDTTIINGRVVMENRTLVGLDAEAITAKAREHAAALWRRV